MSDNRKSLDWISTDQPPPYDKLLLVSNGRDMILTKLHSFNGMFVIMQQIGFESEEYEWKFDVDDIVMWIDLSELIESNLLGKES